MKRLVAGLVICAFLLSACKLSGPGDDGRIVVYNSGTASVREEEELGGCIDEIPGDDGRHRRVVVDGVRRHDLDRTLRTVGYLEYDQERMVSVTTKYPGFIEKAYVNVVGEPVRKG